MTATDIPTLDGARLQAFVGQAVLDMGRSSLGSLSTSATGWVCPRQWPAPVRSPPPHWRSESVQPSGTWLSDQTASGYVVYGPARSTYGSPAEHALVVADEDSPTFHAGASRPLPSAAPT
jgi:hypothetical protein